MIPSKRETCCKRLTGAAIVLAGSVMLSSCCVVYNESKECIQYASPPVVLQMLGDYYGKDPFIDFTAPETLLIRWMPVRKFVVQVRRVRRRTRPCRRRRL